MFHLILSANLSPKSEIFERFCVPAVSQNGAFERDELSIKVFFLYANSMFSGVQLHHRFITISQQTEKIINRYVTTKFSAHVVVTFSVLSIFQLRIANWPHHPRFGLAECARRVSIDLKGQLKRFYLTFQCQCHGTQHKTIQLRTRWTPIRGGASGAWLTTREGSPNPKLAA